MTASTALTIATTELDVRSFSMALRACSSRALHPPATDRLSLSVVAGERGGLFRTASFYVDPVPPQAQDLCITHGLECIRTFD